MWRPPLVLVLTLGIVACGGDDRLSTEDYRAELREICEEADRRTADVREPTRATSAAIADYLRRLRDVNANTIENVQDLEPPEDLQDAHDRALEANREGREKVDQVIEDLEDGGDPAEILAGAREDLEDASRRADDAARAVGVQECID
jgi:hypothetical protein